MLPALLTSPRKLLTLGTAVAVMTALATPPAMADWGPRQQGFVTGVASTLLVSTLIRPYVYYRPAPRYYYPRYVAPRYYPPVYAPRYVAPRYVAPAPAYYSPAPSYAPSIYSTPSASAFNAYDPNQRRQIQSALAASGYYTSSIDGAFGPSTYSAVVAYANSLGNPGLISTTSGAFTLFDGLIY